MRVGGDDGELRPWHYIYVYSIAPSTLTAHTGRVEVEGVQDLLVNAVGALLFKIVAGPN